MNFTRIWHYFTRTMARWIESASEDRIMHVGYVWPFVEGHHVPRECRLSFVCQHSQLDNHKEK
jgi:hypothetical protein